MKKSMLFFTSIFALFGLFILSSCQKEKLEKNLDPDCIACQYTQLTLEDEFSVPNPYQAELFANQLFTLKNDMDGLTHEEANSLGDPAKDPNLLYAILFVENVDVADMLWSWEEADEAEDEIEERASAWKWTGGKHRWSLWCSGHKKWPAQRANGYQDPCNKIAAGWIRYKCCSRLCTNYLPSSCR